MIPGKGKLATSIFYFLNIFMVLRPKKGQCHFGGRFCAEIRQHRNAAQAEPDAARPSTGWLKTTFVFSADCDLFGFVIFISGRTAIRPTPEAFPMRWNRIGARVSCLDLLA
jgi:hypothetical protein